MHYECLRGINDKCKTAFSPFFLLWLTFRTQYKKLIARNGLGRNNAFRAQERMSVSGTRYERATTC